VKLDEKNLKEVEAIGKMSSRIENTMELETKVNNQLR